MRPADFDAFWDSAVETLERTTPLDLQMTRDAEKSTPAYDYYRIHFATACGRRIYGFLTIPTDKAKAPYPVYMLIPGAGPYHDSWWGASDHEITVLLNVLDFDPTEDMQTRFDAMCARACRKRTDTRDRTDRPASPSHVKTFSTIPSFSVSTVL